MRRVTSTAVPLAYCTARSGCTKAVAAFASVAVLAKRCCASPPPVGIAAGPVLVASSVPAALFSSSRRFGPAAGVPQEPATKRRKMLLVHTCPSAAAMAVAVSNRNATVSSVFDDDP